MDFRDIVVIGTSAGGVRALQTLARRLPPNLQAAVFIVMHTAADYKSLLPEILSSAGRDFAVVAADSWAIAGHHAKKSSRAGSPMNPKSAII